MFMDTPSSSIGVFSVTDLTNGAFNLLFYEIVPGTDEQMIYCMGYWFNGKLEDSFTRCRSIPESLLFFHATIVLGSTLRPRSHWHTFHF